MLENLGRRLGIDGQRDVGDEACGVGALLQTLERRHRPGAALLLENVILAMQGAVHRFVLHVGLHFGDLLGDVLGKENLSGV